MPACRQASVRLLRAAVLVLLPLGSTLPLPATAAPAVTVETAAQEIVGLATRTGPMLQTRVLRPPGREPFPLAIVSHGSPPRFAADGRALWQRPVEMFLDSLQH